MVLSQIETMFCSGTKISVSVFDLNVIKIQLRSAIILVNQITYQE